MPSAEFNAVVEALGARPPAIPTDVHGARQAIDELMGSAPLADGVTVEPVTVAARAAEWIRPATATNERVVLYLHGGAFRIGSLHAYRPFASQLAVALETPLLAVDYRLAPEHPFPAGLEDCLAGYAWLLATGWRSDQVAIMGDSAGGGLVASTLLAAKRRGLPQPAAGVCLSPLADLTCSGEVVHAQRRERSVLHHRGCDRRDRATTSETVTRVDLWRRRSSVILPTSRRSSSTRRRTKCSPMTPSHSRHASRTAADACNSTCGRR